jgi:hypothetical protein
MASLDTKYSPAAAASSSSSAGSLPHVMSDTALATLEEDDPVVADGVQQSAELDEATPVSTPHSTSGGAAINSEEWKKDGHNYHPTSRHPSEACLTPLFSLSLFFALLQSCSPHSAVRTTTSRCL